MTVGRDCIYRAVIDETLYQFPSLAEYLDFIRERESVMDDEG